MAQAAQDKSGDAGASFEDAWGALRADEEIQFEAVPPKPKVEPPTWLTDLREWLGEFFALFEGGWPVIRIVLLVLLAAGTLALLWVILRPYIEDWRGRVPNAEEEAWQPDQMAARKLLEEADVLAAKGRFDEATHLLLFRSIEDIEKRRPDLLRPSNTSREIESFESLPEKARNMFAIIASHVEQGIFAAAPIGEDGWNASREAYGEFALKANWRAVAKR